MKIAGVFTEGVTVQEALTGRPTETLYDWLVARIKEAAKTSIKGNITHEDELPSGRYIVSEEWPNKAAYIEFHRIRTTLEDMLYTEGDGGSGGPL